MTLQGRTLGRSGLGPLPYDLDLYADGPRLRFDTCDQDLDGFGKMVEAPNVEDDSLEMRARVVRLDGVEKLLCLAEGDLVAAQIRVRSLVLRGRSPTRFDALGMGRVGTFAGRCARPSQSNGSCAVMEH